MVNLVHSKDEAMCYSVIKSSNVSREGWGEKEEADTAKPTHCISIMGVSSIVGKNLLD